MAWNVYRAVRLRGPVDQAALSLSFERLAGQHDFLRGTLRPDDAGWLPVEIADLRDTPAGLRLPQAMRRAEAAAARRLDVAGEQPWRACLIVLDAKDHLLVLTAHHLACDDRTCGILARELASWYGALTAATGQAPRRPDERSLAYWRTTLAEVPAVLELPVDHIRPGTPSGRAGIVRRVLPAEPGLALRDLAARSGVPVAAVLLAGFAALLRRYSGQDRFSIGTRAGPIPVDLATDHTFTQVFHRTHARLRGAEAHPEVTSQELAAGLGASREPSRHPIWQVSFQYGPERGWDLPGLDATPLALGQEAATGVDLALTVTGPPGAIELAYALDLYEPASAGRLLDAFAHVLAQVAANPAGSPRDVSALPDPERELVVRRWNETAAPYPAGRCLHELFEYQATRQPAATAVIDAAGNAVSYGDLERRANQVAHRLRELGVGPESFVGICMDHSPELLAGLLGILKAGGAYVPLDPEHPPARLGYVLADTGAGVVVTLDGLRGLLPGHCSVLCLDTDRAEIASRPDTPVASGVSAQNLVYAMYTSGSTGHPKGVLISHRNLVNYLWWAVDGYGLPAGSGAPMVGSIAFDLSVPNFFLPLIGGKTVRLLPVRDRLEALAELLAGAGDFSLLKITPGHLDVLRGMLDGERVTSVGTFVVGADEVRPETIAGWQRIAPDARIINEYGPTETVVGCSVYPAGDDFDASAPVPIGRPIANLRMYVLDERLAPVPIGVTGELYIGGDGVARGYLGRPELTAERFIPDPFAPEPGARCYKSGDLARWRPDGNLEFLGRIDHQVKISGYRVEPGEIEARLLSHPDVSEAVVAARAAASGRKRLVAYLVLAPAAARGGDGRGTGKFASWLARSLPGYMVPAQFVLLDRMPLTSAGKVDRDALPDPPRPAGRSR